MFSFYFLPLRRGDADKYKIIFSFVSALSICVLWKKITAEARRLREYYYILSLVKRCASAPPRLNTIFW